MKIGTTYPHEFNNVDVVQRRLNSGQCSVHQWAVTARPRPWGMKTVRKVVWLQVGP